MPHSLAAMVHIQPGSPAAYTFMVLASLTAVAAVVVAGKARAWVRENDPRCHDNIDRAGRD